jgi:hypothetical protein
MQTADNTRPRYAMYGGWGVACPFSTGGRGVACPFSTGGGRGADLAGPGSNSGKRGAAGRGCAGSSSGTATSRERDASS